ncbi:MAG: primosomal protein N' [Clostridia bacterium]|nr:primosomal protein N' [Clostridia bacterium]
MVAEVIINRSAKKLNRTFDYNIPNDLKDFVIVGSKVLVPFGNSKKLEEAYVIGIKDKSEYEVKDIAKLEDNLSDFQIKLAKWMAKHYFCNVSDCIKLMLTPGTGRKENKVQDKTINSVYLKKDIEEIEFEIEKGKIKSDKQKRIIEFVKNNEGCTIPEIEMLTDTTRAVVNTLVKNGYLEIVEKTIQRDPLKHKKLEKTDNLKLTEEQEEAYKSIENTIIKNKYKEFLLYGVTGSGKTEIYLQLIKKVIEEERTAIVLVPEISLTPQMLDRFISRFGKEEIAVLHSKLSLGERHDEWKKIKEGKIKIVIGARSAIFAPLENLGVIIIDEEHDSSYKSESTPRYNAKEIASLLAKVNKCPLVLGSATPDLNTFYRANLDEDNKEKIELLKLTKRANESSLPDVEIIDLKQELANGNRSMLSMDLYDSIEQNLKNKLQTILFLNRRGYSTFIMCRECGYTVKCPNCNISLTYHRFGNVLKCHYCGHEEKVVNVCPECGSDKIRYFGTGTQKLEQEINKLFPNASTIRMDVDTVTKKNSHEVILNKFRDENIDILIGTQMVVKGHHFPNVTLVGVITADSSLNIDDYRANERTFQILTQVAGRAGRENKKGKVIVQSYTPDNFSIVCSQKQNYDMFYETEIAIRKQLKYPPFCDIILIGFSSLNEQEIKKVSNYVYEYLNNALDLEEFNIYRPMPCPVDKIQNRYRWRIIVKGNIDEKSNAILNRLLRELYSKNLKNTKINIDVNPNSMM